MKKIVSALGAVALTAGAASAGGIDRSGQSTSILFEKGNYAEFTFGRVSPSVSGSVGGTSSGDMAGNYNQISGAMKYQFNDRWSAALIVDQPFGADVNYPTGTGYTFAGSSATINTMAMTGLVKYTTPSNMSVFGGLKYQTMSAEASVLPSSVAYTGTAKRDGGFGYVVGAAYEKPEIALRVALTYSSKVKHDFSVSETSALVGGVNQASTTEVETPQSVNLEFQSGVAKDTLVFGSIRWVDWSSFEINPAYYAALFGSELVSYTKDTITYTLGVGRKLNDTWAVSASVGYEKHTGDESSNLGPTDGKQSLTLAAVYTRDNMKITTGVSYVKIGDTYTSIGSAFDNNHAVGVGIKVGYSF
jgi:long-subunit fatty acid transport protein